MSIPLPKPLYINKNKSLNLSEENDANEFINKINDLPLNFTFLIKMKMVYVSNEMTDEKIKKLWDVYYMESINGIRRYKYKQIFGLINEIKNQFTYSY